MTVVEYLDQHIAVRQEYVRSQAERLVREWVLVWWPKTIECTYTIDVMRSHPYHEDQTVWVRLDGRLYLQVNLLEGRVETPAGMVMQSLKDLVALYLLQAPSDCDAETSPPTVQRPTVDELAAFLAETQRAGMNPAAQADHLRQHYPDCVREEGSS